MSAPTCLPPSLPSAAALRLSFDRSGLVIQVRDNPGGPVIAREPVRASDFLPAIQEAWLEGELRRGRMTSSADGLALRLLPILDKRSPGRCLGYVLEATLNGGERVRTVFSFRSLSGVAQRALPRLPLAQAEDGAGPSFHFDLIFDPRQFAESPAPAAGPSLLAAGPVTRRLLQFHRVPLAPLLARSAASAPYPGLPLQRNPFPVFYTQDAFAKAEAFARAGEATLDRVESGAALGGCLCSCPDSGECFVVVLDAIDVEAADQSQFSLTLSGESWRRIRSAIAARQASLPSFRLQGQAHGHNFLPNEGKTCADCFSRPYCDVTNLFVSADDLNWTRAVFSQQPWSLCHIFGLTARQDRIDGLFTLRDGQLSHRGYHLLPAFNPDDYPTLTAPASLHNP